MPSKVLDTVSDCKDIVIHDAKSKGEGLLQLWMNRKAMYLHG